MVIHIPLVYNKVLEIYKHIDGEHCSISSSESLNNTLTNEIHEQRSVFSHPSKRSRTMSTPYTTLLFHQHHPRSPAHRHNGTGVSGRTRRIPQSYLVCFTVKLIFHKVVVAQPLSATRIYRDPFNSRFFSASEVIAAHLDYPGLITRTF